MTPAHVVADVRVLSTSADGHPATFRWVDSAGDEVLLGAGQVLACSVAGLFPDQSSTTGRPGSSTTVVTPSKVSPELTAAPASVTLSPPGTTAAGTTSVATAAEDLAAKVWREVVLAMTAVFPAGGVLGLMSWLAHRYRRRGDAHKLRYVLTLILNH